MTIALRPSRLLKRFPSKCAGLSEAALCIPVLFESGCEHTTLDPDDRVAHSPNQLHWV